MTTFVSILRGINVGGHRSIRMADLNALFESLKFRDVATYVQSGNVVFKATAGTTAKIAGRIETAISERFGFDVPVLVRSANEMKTTVAGNPFVKERGIGLDKLHVTFLGSLPDVALVENLTGEEYYPDRFVINGRDVYLHCPDKYGGTKLSNAFFERKLRVCATTRNWKTVTTLLAMAT